MLSGVKEFARRERGRAWLSAMAAILFLLLVTFAAAGCGEEAAEEEQVPQSAEETLTIKVGIIDSYSGPASGYAEDGLDGFKLAVEELAEAGNVNIEFETRDSEFDVSKALEAAKDLVMRENVDVLAGTINSAAALAVSDYAKDEQIPFLVWHAQSEKITGEQGHRYVFGMMPNAAMSGRAGALAMSDLAHQNQNYWLAGSDYEYGHAIVGNFWSTLKEENPEAQQLGESWWPVGEADFTPYINAIRSESPDALAIGAGGADMVSVMKAIANSGLQEEMDIYLHTATDLGTLSPLGENAPAGVYGTNSYHYYYPDSPENNSFSEGFMEAYERQPGFTALNGYVSAKFIAEALTIAGEADAEKLVDALEGLTIDSPVGEVGLREYDHQIIAPLFFGKTAKDPDNPYLIATDVVTIPGDEAIIPEEEVRAARGE